MTAATLTPPTAVPEPSTTASRTTTPQRAPSVRSSHDQKRAARDSSLHRQESRHSHHNSIDKSQDHSIHRRQSERRKTMRVGNYVISRKTIGAGSMGKVKLAECITDNDRQQYAVKIMPKVNITSASSGSSSSNGNGKPKDPKDTPKEREQRTIREMAMMHLLRHPNICQLKEWVTEGDYYYMFLEYVNGGQLLDYIISHGKLREKQARKFARQIASALDYCHRNSIVHRENILITRDEDVKIIDFGLSNIYSPSRLLSTFCGSLYFAAPELLQARHYTGPEVDVWSFGVVLYVLVCGRVPFDDTSLPALHAKIKAGRVDGYPDHLSKDCVDLLTRVLVVDPKRRATLSQVINHPWMNKGYDDPVTNYIPHRQALESIDMDVVEGMGGFGFGDPRDIYASLEHIIANSDYQKAASRVDQNYQHQLHYQQQQSSKPRWRRSLRSPSTRRNASSQHQQQHAMDDPQSLPAMYDPLVSIYYLVKEKKEFDQRQQQLKDQRLAPAAQSVPILRRSNSSSFSSMGGGSSHVDSGLTRRKTDRIPNTPKLNDNDENSNGMMPRSGSLHFPTRSQSTRVATTSSTLLSRSKSAARRLGAIIPSNNNNHQQRSSLDADKVLPPIPTTNTIPPPHLETEKTPTSSLSTPLKKTFHQLVTTTTTATSNKENDKQQQQHRPSPWRRLSIGRGAKQHNRASMEAASAHEPMPTNKPIPSSARSSDIADPTIDPSSVAGPAMSTHPKSLFNFNRRHLFRSTPQKLLDDLNDLLSLMSIKTQQSMLEPYVLFCECDYPDWTRFLSKAPTVENPTSDSTTTPSGQSSRIEYSDLEEGEPLRFTVMIYQARWAGGRLGVKVKEAEIDEAILTSHTKIYRNLYHIILCELGKMTSSR
ncbi:serine threonine protein kinase [Lichtheimia corymbifera JMRC:FSU:9682]|uniref:Serine threonine protein kinase n=1 Tax=Lichtheimia corymbifera JMRC:FSU:9682 TaxID=1263082 RepID=A0A068RZC7_9FUNG|nr:serine threonine protein kinase [Lichtheimia corymbifera JMRC:FSU:9682]